MTGQLTEFVQRNYAEAVSAPLGAWLVDHDFPVIVEPKYDGRRVFLFYSKGVGVYVTKHQGTYRIDNHPELFSIMPRFNARQLILDCENYPRSNPDRVVAFDVLHIDGIDLTGWPLSERKVNLMRVFEDTEKFTRAPWFAARSSTEVLALKERFVAEGFEGAMVKDELAPYGRRGSWLKAKKLDTGDFIVVGPDPENDSYRRTGVARSWFVGAHDPQGRMVDWGKVGSYVDGVDPAQVKPGTVVEVAFQEMTKDGRLRDPRILRIRDDKTADECVEEAGN